MIKVFYHLIIPAKNVFVIFITKNYKKTYGHIIACETIGVLRGFFIVGRFLFVYFIFTAKMTRSLFGWMFWLRIYHGAHLTVRRIFDSTRSLMSMLLLLAFLHSGEPYVQMGLRVEL